MEVDAVDRFTSLSRFSRCAREVVEARRDDGDAMASLDELTTEIAVAGVARCS
jgi:hypothetical protein